MKTTLFATAVLLIAFVAAPAGAATLGMIDDFQDLTTQGWMSGGPNPNPPINVADAGQLGVGDHVLQISAHGNGGAGTNLVAFNTSQWTGDFTAAGITEIRFDASNVGNNPISLGFEINGSAITFDTGTISPGSGWNNYSIPLTSLVFGSPANLNSVSELRLRYIQGGSFIGGVAAEVHVDNIQAVPEPSALLLVCGMAMLVGLTRRPWVRG